MALIFDQLEVGKIQQANDIVDVVSEHISLTKKGREMVGLCPFHDDHRPSMYVNSAKQIFKCFACGAGGDVFKFVQLIENLTFPQAVERLAEQAGIKLRPAKFTKAQTQGKSYQLEPNTLARVNAWAAKYFQANLTDPQKGKQARDYIDQRQFPAESVKKWSLGLALSSPDDLIEAAKAKNISMKLLAGAGLVVKTESGGFVDKFVNRLMFPITDVTARVIGFGGRTLDQTGAKYINSPATVLFDKSNSLYGLHQARHQIVSTKTAVVVEGYTDCIMAHSKGCNNVVATMGTSYAKKVVLVFDSDTAGLEAANRALEVCLSQHIDIKLAAVPEGKDPCDFLLTAGKEEFEKLTDNAVDVFQFKWNRLIDQLKASDTLIDHKAAIEQFLQAIATSLHAGSLSAIDKGLMVNRLSRIINISPKEINTELSKRIGRLAKTSAYAANQRKVAPIDLGQGLFATAQRELLEVLLNEPELFKSVKKEITAEIFDVPILRQIAHILFESIKTGGDTSLKAILAKAESPQIGSAIVELAQVGERKANSQARLTGAIDVVRRELTKKKTSEIRSPKDQARLLRSFSENIGKQNPHSLGMVQ